MAGQRTALDATGNVSGMRNANAGMELQNEGTLQNAVNLGLEPARIQSGAFGTSQQGQANTMSGIGQNAQLSKQPGFLKSLAMTAASGLASGAGSALTGGLLGAKK